MISIQKLCPKSVLLKNGKLEKVGYSQDIIFNYLHAFDNTDYQQSLEDVKSRKGDQTLIFTKVEIFDLNKKQIKKVISGQDIILRFYYKCINPRNNADVCVSFVVMESDYSLTNINTIDSGQSNLELFQYGYFECKWNKFNLTANSYDCSLFCSINGIISDWIERAFTLEVEDGDFFNSGKKIGFQSKFLVPNTWISKKQ